MYCPKCGSDRVITATETETHTSNNGCCGFDCLLSFLGYLLFSVPGILCGLCGDTGGTSTKTKVVNVCQNCGHRF
ncbi:MAG: hypothetical protein ACI4VF_05550 [Lachnospirales bacterium]